MQVSILVQGFYTSPFRIQRSCVLIIVVLSLPTFLIHGQFHGKASGGRGWVDLPGSSLG